MAKEIEEKPYDWKSGA